MTRLEVLELLKRLVQDSVKVVNASDDQSGLYTEYLVDQEALMANIEAERREEVARLSREHTDSWQE